MFKSYFRISVALCLVLSIAYLYSIRGPFRMASDGSGPDGGALLAFFIFIVACVLHVLTFIVALFRYGGNRSGTAIGLCILAFSAFLLLFPKIKSTTKKAISDYQFNSSFTIKTEQTIRSGTPEDFFKNFNQISAKEKTWGYVHELMEELCKAGRLDILEQLEEKGFPIAEADKEFAWADLVYAPVYSTQISPEKRLAVMEWIFAKGEPFKFSLKNSQHEFFSTYNFSNFFGDVKNPSSRKTFDLLIEHGAKFKGRTSEHLLWESVRSHKSDHVKFLISQKVDPNYVDEDSRTSTLDEAIDNKDQAIIEQLLKVGAKKSSELAK